MAIASFICGLISLLGSWIPIIGSPSFILSILAIVFGVKGKKEEEQKSFAQAGLVMGIISLCFSILSIMFVIFFATSFFTYASSIFF